MASTLPHRAGQVVIPSGAYVHVGDVQQRDRACKGRAEQFAMYAYLPYRVHARPAPTQR